MNQIVFNTENTDKKINEILETAEYKAVSDKLDAYLADIPRNKELGNEYISHVFAAKDGLIIRTNLGAYLIKRMVKQFDPAEYTIAEGNIELATPEKILDVVHTYHYAINTFDLGKVEAFAQKHLATVAGEYTALQLAITAPNIDVTFVHVFDHGVAQRLTQYIFV